MFDAIKVLAIPRSPVPNYSKLPNYFNVIKQQNYTNYSVVSPNPSPVVVLLFLTLK